MNSARRMRRTLWSAVILLALISVAVVVRRTTNLVLILINGYHPPAAASNLTAAQLAALDDVFARYPVLTLIHILPGVLFMGLGPLQFNATLRARHRQWHRWSGRVYLICSLIIGVSALVMSVAMPSDFFLILKGRLTIGLRDREVVLGSGELFVVPRGVEHQPFAEEETHLLLIEPGGTPNTGNPATAAPRQAI